MDESRDGITRVKKIVQDLKDFSHQGGDEDWQWALLHDGLDTTLNIVNNEIKYKAKVVKEYGDIPPIQCLSSQINQVLMNILVNAAHSIEGTGTITIRTAERDDEVRVEVSDTGSGIAPEHMTRIFDPFFTTKPVGKGTGLGLSLSYSIVQKHHGRIEVESELGKGTTFRVCLPIRQEGDAKEPAAA
jgi:two-component system NtrC family sensor kinase